MNKSKHLLADGQISNYAVLKFERQSVQGSRYFPVFVNDRLAVILHATQQNLNGFLVELKRNRVE